MMEHKIDKYIIRYINKHMKLELDILGSDLGLLNNDN